MFWFMSLLVTHCYISEFTRNKIFVQGNKNVFGSRTKFYITFTFFQKYLWIFETYNAVGHQLDIDISGGESLPIT